MKTTTEKMANSIEALESRIAPAGVVTVTLQNGVLTISGDAANNDLLIYGGPNGQLLIAPGDNTDAGAGINVARKITGPVRSIVCDMGDGNDSLRLVDFKTLTRISVTGGIGDDYIQLSDLRVTGGMQVDLGEGNDRFDLSGVRVSIGGNLAIQGGEGDNTFSFSALELTVQGKLTVSAGSGTDSFETSSTDLRLQKNATLALGEDENTIAFSDNARTQVRGNLSIIGGSSLDGISLGAGALLSVRGNLNFDLGNGQNSIVENEAATISVGGTLRATGGFNTDNFEFIGQRLTARDLVLDPGDGLNTITLSGPSAKVRNLTITGGADSDTINIPISDLTITGRLLLDVGDGANDVSIITGSLSIGSAKFLGGAGSDDMEVLGTGRFSGPVLVDLATGDSQGITFDGIYSGLVFGSSLTVRSTSGAESSDGIVLRTAEVRGKTDIQLGDGSSSVDIDDVYLKNTVVVQTNGGNDRIHIERNPIYLLPFESLALKPVTIRTGAGDDEVLIGTGVQGTWVDFRGKLSVIDEGGTDTINNVAGANLFRPSIPPVITGFENVVT